jgi:hypothetical protein
MVRAWDIPIEELQNFWWEIVEMNIVKAAIALIDPVVIDYLVDEPGSHKPTFVEGAAIMKCMNELAGNAQPYMTKPYFTKILEAQLALQAYLDQFYPGNPTQYIEREARAGNPHVGESTLCEMRQLLD